MELCHHGIQGQKWGERNGPPYPLSGGDYSKEEKVKIYRARLRKNSIYNKKHFDKVIEEGKTISTLSYDENRTKDTDMFYGAYDFFDKHEYNALFNKKIPKELFDEDGNSLGTGMCYKFRINNTANQDIKVASEDSAENAFLNLYSNNRDFYNFVTDPDRMESQFVESKYRFSGYRDAKKALDRVRESDTPSEKDLRTVYRMFNYVIPSDGGGNERVGKDVATQRAKLFKELKSEGYSALLDTNDSIYGGFKANAPVIVFDMESIALKNVQNVHLTDKAFSNVVFYMKKKYNL